MNGPSELVVESEAEPGSMLVQVPLDASTSFRRVRSGIVSWVNEHTKVERALSFEVPALCHILYVRICEAQGLTVDHKFERTGPLPPRRAPGDGGRDADSRHPCLAFVRVPHSGGRRSPRRGHVHGK